MIQSEPAKRFHQAQLPLLFDESPDKTNRKLPLH
jgi:hypothetical protein